MAPTHRPTTVDADTVEFIRLGDLVSLDFKAGIRNIETFAAAMAAHRGCNQFDPERVAKTFAPLFDDVSTVEFGAEGSPVMYVSLPYWPQQRNGGARPGEAREKYSDETRRDLAARVIAWARSVEADEISSYQKPGNGDPVWNGTGEQPRRIRIWWD